MFAFITGSPSVYIGFFNISETVYTLFFGASIVTMIQANRLNVRLLRFCNPSYLLSLGQSIQMVTVITLLSYVFVFDAPLLAVVVGLVMLFVGSQNFIVSNTPPARLSFPLIIALQLLHYWVQAGLRRLL